jgi:hypothetical protein
VYLILYTTHYKNNICIIIVCAGISGAWCICKTCSVNGCCHSRPMDCLACRAEVWFIDTSCVTRTGVNQHQQVTHVARWKSCRIGAHRYRHLFINLCTWVLIDCFIDLTIYRHEWIAIKHLNVLRTCLNGLLEHACVNMSLPLKLQPDVSLLRCSRKSRQ